MTQPEQFLNDQVFDLSGGNVLRYGILFAIVLTSLTVQVQSSGGASDVGNVNDVGLILITTRDPSSYIATSEGTALYTLINGNGEVLPCPAECLQSWPAFTGAAEADAGTGFNPDLVGTTQTEDGQEQVTYNDFPLYAYSGDQQPVDVTGQGVEGFGGTWYVVGENGTPVISDPEATGTQQ